MSTGRHGVRELIWSKTSVSFFTRACNRPHSLQYSKASPARTACLAPAQQGEEVFEATRSCTMAKTTQEPYRDQCKVDIDLEWELRRRMVELGTEAQLGVFGLQLSLGPKKVEGSIVRLIAGGMISVCFACCATHLLGTHLLCLACTCMKSPPAESWWVDEIISTRRSAPSNYLHSLPGVSIARGCRGLSAKVSLSCSIFSQ